MIKDRNLTIECVIDNINAKYQDLLLIEGTVADIALYSSSTANKRINLSSDDNELIMLDM